MLSSETEGDIFLRGCFGLRQSRYVNEVANILGRHRNLVSYSEFNTFASLCSESIKHLECLHIVVATGHVQIYFKTEQIAQKFFQSVLY